MKAAVPPGQGRWLNLGSPLPREVLQAPDLQDGSKAKGNASTANRIRPQHCGAHGRCWDRTRPRAAPAFQETESTASKTSAGNPRAGLGKVELEHPGGILFAALSSEQGRANSATAQLCTNEIEADKAATCHTAPSGGTVSTFLLCRG